MNVVVLTHRHELRQRVGIGLLQLLLFHQIALVTVVVVVVVVVVAHACAKRIKLLALQSTQRLDLSHLLEVLKQKIGVEVALLLLLLLLLLLAHE